MVSKGGRMGRLSGSSSSWAWSPWTYALSVAIMVALTVAAGLGASVHALMARPLTVLRAED